VKKFPAPSLNIVRTYYSLHQIEPQHTNPDSQHTGTAVRNALPAVMQNGLNESGKLSDNIMSLYYTILVFA